MERHFETVMIEQCSPVLAGLKPANLFRHETRDKAGLYRRVAGWNAQLGGRGLRLVILKECPRGHWFLLYLYRPARLAAILEQPDACRFLEQEGYTLPARPGSPAGCQALLHQLSHRLCGDSFPHEIGVFLGYPLSDVIGFIRNQGRNFTCCGCWKSYGDPDAAQRYFDQLKKCTDIYLRLFHSGTPILRLAVSV